MIDFKECPYARSLPLPSPGRLSFDIGRALTERRSSRSFVPGGITPALLSSLLYFTAGITYPRAVRAGTDDWEETRRPYPSAGASYPIELYVLLSGTSSPEEGVYHYNVKAHSLELLKEGNPSGELAKVTGQDWLSGSQLKVVLTGVFTRTMNLYSERGYRYVLMEAGHVMQNLLLVAKALGLASCPVGAFLDRGVEELLRLDGGREAALYMAALGMGGSTRREPEW